MATSAHPAAEARTGLLSRWRRDFARQLEEAGGRHDEPEIYCGEPGDPGLAGGPGGLSWEIHGDLASLALAGTGAILLEVLHPSVMAGVFEHSAYRTETLRRARNTLGYVLRTTFGSTPGATRVIEQVKRIHSQVAGVRADGVPYRALDPELIGWVHTCIPWAVMTAFERTRRPLSDAEKSRYLAEQAVIGRMGGAGRVPESISELWDYVESMRPKLRMTEQTDSFLDFVAGRGEPLGRLERFDRWTGLCASMSLMPAWAQELTETRQPGWVRALWLEPSNRWKARLVRWAMPELPCKQLALARIAGAAHGRAPAAA